MKRIQPIFCITMLTLFFICPLHAKNTNTDPTIQIHAGSLNTVVTRSQLLQRKDMITITLANPAYKGITIPYNAIKLCDLLNPYKINPTDTIEFKGSDGFASLIPAKIVLNCSVNASAAYLAIEPVDHLWPLLHNGSVGTAGPFALVWSAPEKSHISNEYWPWKLAQIIVHNKLSSNLFISAPNTKDKQVQAGFNAFRANCAECHSMNGVGVTEIGPDLNAPYNVVEYYKNDAFIKQFIRNPRSVRLMKNDKMSGFDKHALSDQELDTIVIYLHYMADHKK